MTTSTHTITGIVIGREDKHGSTSGKPWTRFGIQVVGPEGKSWYTTFDTALPMPAQGQTIDLWYTEKPNPMSDTPYRTIEFWREVENVTPVTAKPAPSTNLDQRIAWNSAVNNAVHLYHPRQPDETIDWDVILDDAKTIYQIITAGPPQEHAQDGPQMDVETPWDDEMEMEV